MVEKAIRINDCTIDISNIPITNNEEPFIKLNGLAQEKIIFEPAYYNRKIDGATKDFYLRQQTTKLLIEASLLLPDDLRIKIFDAWRPAMVQKNLYYGYYDALKGEPGHQDKSSEELHALANKYVSFPSNSEYKPFLHSTGGAIDLTIADRYGNNMEMGTEFDDFNEKSNTDYFEKYSTENSDVIKKNRRILYNIMIDAGFTNYPNEWWHYDYGDVNWAFYKKSPSFYTGVFHVDDLHIT